MSEPTVVKAEGGNNPADVVGPAPPATAASSGAARPAAGAETFRTAEALKHWPVVLFAVQKSSEAYFSVKQSARIIGWSLSLTEKAVGLVFKFAESKVSSLRPVIQYADKTVSNGVVAIERKFPAVRESPDKLYNAITQQITKKVRPTLDKFASVRQMSRKKLDRAARKIVKTYNRLMRRVDRWLDTWEKRLNRAELQAVTGEVNEGAGSSGAVVRKTAAPLDRVLRLFSGVAASARWLLSRVPLVGGFLSGASASDPSRPPSSTSSSSSSYVTTSSSSSSSWLTPPAASEQAGRSRPLAMHHDLFLTLPLQTTA